MDKLQLEVMLKAIDQVTAPLKGITAGSKETAQSVREAKNALKDLEQQQGLIEKFRDTNRMLAITRNELKTARENVRDLAKQMDEAETPTKAMTKAFEAAKQEVRNLKDRQTELIDKQQTLRGALDGAGLSTTNLAAHQKQLKGDIAAASAEVEKQSAALNVHNERMRAMNAAQSEYRKTIALRNQLAMGGATTMAAGMAMGAPILASVKAASDFEDSMLGVARQVDGATDANGNYTQTYYDMAKSIKAMSEQLPLAANDIAALVEAGARMGIQGKDNLTTYAKLTAVMSAAFDIPADKIGDDMAKLAGIYHVPVKDIHELGDAINYLDDRSKAIAPDIIEVMKRIAGPATTAKMSYKEAGALATTMLSLGTAPEVAATSINAMINILGAAKMQSKRFNIGMEMLKLDPAKLQAQMTKDATGTIMKVLEAINALPDSKRIEATVRLFGREYGPAVGKLAGNLKDYRQELAWSNAEQAKGSMDLEMQKRLKTTSAQYQMMSNTLGNLATDIGATLKPALVDLMKQVSGVLKGFRDWANENPELVAKITKVAAVVATVTTVLGAAGIALAAILGPLAIAKLSMSYLGIASSGLGGKLGLILGPLGKITTAFGVGYAAGTLLLKGIDALLSKLTGKNTNLGSWIFDLVQAVKAKTAWLKKLPTEMLGIGSALVDGIIGGIKARMAALKSTITGVGQETVAWLKNTLGIKSPSKVFQELGIYTMQGLEQGITGGQGAPLAAIARMAKQLAGAGAGMMIGTAAIAGGIDHRPPPASSAQGGGYTVINHITIQAGPGMNEKSLAQEVARQIDMIERGRAAQGRSRFGDRA